MTLGPNYASEPVHLCFQSGASAVSSSPVCGTAGSAATIDGTSGAGVVCTGTLTSGTRSLVLTDATQTNIWIRVCESGSDTLQSANGNVALTQCKEPVDRTRQSTFWSTVL